MGLFDKLKNLAFVPEETPVQDNVPADQLDKSGPGMTQPTAAPVRTRGTDEAIKKEILSTVSSCDPVYAQFFDMVASLRGVIPDERTCYNSAFVALSKTVGLTVDQIIYSIDNTLQCLGKENQKFLQTLEDKKLDIESLQKGIKSRDAQVAELRQQIASLEAEKSKIQQNVDKETRSIESVTLNFNGASKSVETELNNSKTKIMSYLNKGVK